MAINKGNIPRAALALALFVLVGIYYYRATMKETYPGETEYRMAGARLEKGEYGASIKLFDDALGANPDLAPALLGKGIAYMQLEEYEKARTSLDKAIEIDDGFAEAYANRGILRDRMGEYREAIGDYRKACELKPELAEGPGLIWRFLHNVSEKPPTLLDRAAYLEAELNKAESERVLRVPEIDAEQRMYKK